MILFLLEHFSDILFVSMIFENNSRYLFQSTKLVLRHFNYFNDFVSSELILRHFLVVILCYEKFFILGIIYSHLRIQGV